MGAFAVMGDAYRIAAIENLPAHRADDQMLDRALRIGLLAEVFNCGLGHEGATLGAEAWQGNRALLVPLLFAARGMGGAPIPNVLTRTSPSLGGVRVGSVPPAS